MSVHANIEPLRWESDFFGFSNGRLVCDPSAPVVTGRDLDAFQIVQAKVAAGDTQQIDALAALGFRLVEGEVDLSVRWAALTDPPPDISAAAAQSIGRQPGIDAAKNVAGRTANGAGKNSAISLDTSVAVDWDDYLGAGIRLADQNDIPALRRMASAAFTLSRFREPWYRGQDNRRFYALWAENAVLGRFDHRCLVIGRPDALSGMITLRDLGAKEARIGLLAVDPALGGQGYGRLLFNAALAWCRRHHQQRLRVATQTGNIAALRLYIACGANIDSAAYWLYR